MSLGEDKGKKTQITNVGEYIKKLEPLNTADENRKWCSHYGKQLVFPQK